MWRKIIPPPTLPMFNDGSILRNVWKCHRHQHRHTHTLARRSPIRGERAPPIAIQRNDVNDVPVVYSNDVILLMPSLFPIFLLSDWTFPLSSTSSSLWLKNKSYIYNTLSHLYTILFSTCDTTIRAAILFGSLCHWARRYSYRRAWQINKERKSKRKKKGKFLVIIASVLSDCCFVYVVYNIYLETAVFVSHKYNIRQTKYLFLCIDV